MKRDPSILLIDDDEDFLMVAERAIQRADLNARVHVARNGVEALEALGNGPGLHPPDLVLIMLDLSMPGVNGWEVLRRIRQDPRTRQVPVVIISSSDRPDDVERSYALGANSFLLKRFDPRGPGRYLAEAARYWIELNQPPGALAGGRR